MYEQVSHATLNRILDELKPEIRKKELRFFYSRLGANFYAIYSLFKQLYGNREDFYPALEKLVEVMARNYEQRPEEYKLKDRAREADNNWFLSQNWVGMALYANGYADDLSDLNKKVGYFKELGVNLVHILPILECPAGKSDGGYAVSNFRQVDARLGKNKDLQKVIHSLHECDALIALDIVLNHTSDEHEWARRAADGEKRYQEFFYTFDSRNIPDMFEQSMLEVFPETDPGNFTWNDSMQKWVMTAFHHYQWDLNYTNPTVFIEMLDIILYWANQGVDVLRLDAVAFLWKKIGTACQNEREAHLVLQLFKDCCQVVAPGLLFIAEAIVAPLEVIKYFGEDAVVAKECEIAYNATFMALIWDAVATKNGRLLKQGLKSLPSKLEGATWLNYLRCHDDIGFGFDDNDIARVGYNPWEHRRFLINYYTGEFDHSLAAGAPFARNEKTGDARISGSLASLVGLEKALELNDPALIDNCVQHIIMLHSLIMSFGGIPLLYYGDEVATLNDYSYQSDEQKSHDSRWLHRPRLNWDIVDRRFEKGSLEARVFSAIQRLIRVRKNTPMFADFNNRELVDLSNDALFAYLRYDSENPSEKLLVTANLSGDPQQVGTIEIEHYFHTELRNCNDSWSESTPTVFSNNLIFKPYQFYWLTLAGV